MGHKDHHNVAECSLLASFFLESKNKNKTKPDRPPKSLAQINTLTHSCWCSYQLYSLETKATYLPLDTASASNFWRGGCRQRDPVLPVANFYNILGRFFCCCCSFFCCFFFLHFFILPPLWAGWADVLAQDSWLAARQQPPAIIGPTCCPCFSTHFPSPVYIMQVTMLWNWDFSNYFKLFLFLLKHACE